MFNQAATSLKSKNDISISLFTLKSRNDTLLSGTEREQIIDLGEHTSVIEVEATNGNVLFIFDRFIDNGYGLLYVNNPKILKAARPNVVYDLTSWVPLCENWYYVSFT